MEEERDLSKKPTSLPHKHPDSNKLKGIEAKTIEVNYNTDLQEIVDKIANDYEKSRDEDFGYRILFANELADKEPVFENTLSNIFKQRDPDISLRKATYIHDNDHCGIFIAKPSVYEKNSISETNSIAFEL